VRTLLVVALLVLALACGDDDGDGGDDAAATSSTIGAPSTTTTSTTTPGPAGDPALREELLALMEQDVAERTGQATTNGDATRADRLREIIAEHGWPTFALVSTDGATAAWLIAQHADFDPAFQQQVVELMRPLVDGGQADASELAYLEDRVAVNTGQDQVYGTQIRCQGGEPVPATPIVDEAAVDERRAAVGLAPLADYYAELAAACAAEE
jgi:hypothetical protein